MKELNYLLMGWSAMKSLPFCLLNHELPKLKIIQFDYVEIFDIFGNNSNNETFSYIEKLFTLPSLQELSLFTTPLTLFNFPKNAFNYNPNTQYIFDNTFHLCGYYYRFPHMIYLHSRYLWHFLVDTDACNNYNLKTNESVSYDVLNISHVIKITYPFNMDYYINYYNISYNNATKYNKTLGLKEFGRFFFNKRIFTCSPHNFNDGVCHDECDDNLLAYDGGDCMQLCDFDTCTPELFTDNNCSSACNTTQCHYDVHKCGVIDTDACIEKSGYKECVYVDVTSKELGLIIESEESYVNDQWCEDPCNIPECNWDNGACGSCNGSPWCKEFRNYYSILAGTEFVLYRSTFSLVAPLLWSSIFTDDTWDLSNTYGFNLSTAFDIFDIDKNGYLNAYESMVVMNSGPGVEGFIWVENRKEFKSIGSIINCSLCFPNVDVYYKPWNSIQREYYITHTHELIKNESDKYFYSTNFTQ